MKDPKDELKLLLDQRALDLEEAWNEVRKSRAKLSVMSEHLKRIAGIAKHIGAESCKGSLRSNPETMRCPKCLADVAFEHLNNTHEKTANKKKEGR